MIKLENVTVCYNNQTVIDGLTFSFEEGKITAITGPSGVGKTTIINIVAGLIIPKSGKSISDIHKVSYIFQEPRLFPWMTALENVECVCRDKEKSEYYLNLLLPNNANKYPHELSGGMKQRVSIARALSYEPQLLLLDEPFKGLDEETKQQTMNIVSEFLVDRTGIIVTHDKDDLNMCHLVYKTEGIPVRSLCCIKDNRD